MTQVQIYVFPTKKEIISHLRKNPKTRDLFPLYEKSMEDAATIFDKKTKVLIGIHITSRVSLKNLNNEDQKVLREPLIEALKTCARKSPYNHSRL